MANHSRNLESARELAIMDKERIRNKYQPPDISELPYAIHDIHLHCRYYYKTEAKFKRNVKRFSRIPDAEFRFIFIDSKQE